MYPASVHILNETSNIMVDQAYLERVVGQFEDLPLGIKGDHFAILKFTNGVIELSMRLHFTQRDQIPVQ